MVIQFQAFSGLVLIDDSNLTYYNYAGL